MYAALQVAREGRFVEAQAAKERRKVGPHVFPALWKRAWLVTPLRPSQLDKAWAKYDRKMTAALCRAKPPANWVPQVDHVSGDTHYLNVETGSVSEEHPSASRQWGGLCHSALTRPRAQTCASCAGRGRSSTSASQQSWR